LLLSTELIVKIIYTWEEYAGNKLMYLYFINTLKRILRDYTRSPLFNNNGEDIVHPGRKLLKGFLIP
jgi:hypothetical protein